MKVEELKKIRKAINQGLKKQFSLSETDLLAPNVQSWDNMKEEFKAKIATLISNLENDAYDDASGDIDKVISMLNSWKKKIQKDINDNDLKENINPGPMQYIQHHLPQEFLKYIIPGTEKFEVEPSSNNDGSYEVEVQLAIPRYSFPDLETATLETNNQIRFDDNQGPGQSFARGYVYAIKQNARDYILGFSISGGYDI